jgi:hypothetical protein
MLVPLFQMVVASWIGFCFIRRPEEPSYNLFWRIANKHFVTTELGAAETLVDADGEFKTPADG